MIVIKKAQELPTTTIILAAIGLVVLIILFAFVTGKLGTLGRGLSECPGQCLGPYVGDAVDSSVECEPSISKELTGDFIQAGQKGVPVDKVRKCSKCCASLI